MKGFFYMLEAIIFDKDGTLFDTEKLNIHFWLEAFKKAGAKDDDTIIKSCIGLDKKKADQILLDAYGSYGLDEIARNKDQWVRDYILTNGVPLKLGTKEIILFAKEKGLKVGIATSTLFNEASFNLKKAGLWDLLDSFTSGEEVEKGKPSPDIFLLSAKKMEVKPENTIVVEDSPHGIKAANRGGFIGILIPDLIKPNREMMNDATYTLDNLLEVKKVIDLKLGK